MTVLVYFEVLIVTDGPFSNYVTRDKWVGINQRKFREWPGPKADKTECDAGQNTLKVDTGKRDAVQSEERGA